MAMDAPYLFILAVCTIAIFGRINGDELSNQQAAALGSQDIQPVADRENVNSAVGVANKAAAAYGELAKQTDRFVKPAGEMYDSLKKNIIPHVKDALGDKRQDTVERLNAAARTAVGSRSARKGASMKLAESEQCAADIKAICPEEKRRSNFNVLECLQNQPKVSSS